MFFNTRILIRVLGAIGFGFASHWLESWCEICEPVVKRGIRYRRITSESHLKTALICVVNVFHSAVVLYATTAVYFAGVMVRLMLTLTPVVCILAAIAFSVTLDNYLVDDRSSEGKDAVADQASVESVAEENDKKKKKDLYDKVCRQIVLNSLELCCQDNGVNHIGVVTSVQLGQRGF